MLIRLTACSRNAHRITDTGDTKLLRKCSQNDRHRRYKIASEMLTEWQTQEIKNKDIYNTQGSQSVIGKALGVNPEKNLSCNPCKWWHEGIAFCCH